MMLWLTWLAGSRVGRFVAGGVAVLVFVLGFALDQRHRGAVKAVAKIERATQHAVSKANSAGSKSSSGAGRVLDPYTLPD